jgi:heme/copper-type cytochrome/quinol oxidase subunit 3
MLVAGISDASAIYFSIITFGVAIPTAVKVFNWVSTMYRGSISFETPMLYAMSFVFLFMIAGTTGVYLATLAVDVFYHDTYFVVAHFHYTIQGGAVIGLIAALHFWFPKMTGKMYNEHVAKIGFVLVFVGFNLTFLPQFVLGMMGMPRRYYDYHPDFEYLHTWSTVGAFVNGFGYTFALVNLAWSAFFSKKKAPANPWESLSLEWQTQSPPIHENFEKTPVVTDWTYGSAKFGMWLFLATEILLFGGLFCGFAVYRWMYLEEFHAGSHHLNKWIGAFNTVVLLASSYTAALAVDAAQHNNNKAIVKNMMFSVFCGLIFLLVKAYEYYHKYTEGLFPIFGGPNGIQFGEYKVFFGLYYCMTALHALHVVIGMGLMLWVVMLARRERFSSRYYTPVEVGALYWHLVDLIWIYLFPLLYLVG